MSRYEWGERRIKITGGAMMTAEASLLWISAMLFLCYGLGLGLGPACVAIVKRVL